MLGEPSRRSARVRHRGRAVAGRSARAFATSRRSGGTGRSSAARRRRLVRRRQPARSSACSDSSVPAPASSARRSSAPGAGAVVGDDRGRRRAVRSARREDAHRPRHRLRRPRIGATRSSASTRSPTTSAMASLAASAAGLPRRCQRIRTESTPPHPTSSRIRAPGETVRRGHAERRQPAEGPGRPVARRRHADPDPRRSDAGRRRRGARRDPRPSSASSPRPVGPCCWCRPTPSELLAVCSRILVMRDGRLVAELAADETTEGELIEIAAGARRVGPRGDEVSLYVIDSQTLADQAATTRAARSTCATTPC